ncbi:MAG: prepilin-type N-terminal cleavage/methylation domain-containing protein [Deltaproteobacteria bacterium]|jgi:prepilin-type N-terminal cleavage/methylation domain-containing protein|nr:prepilin-type N-terminal cleavage/methylation domain-containing protein [Deltaproteobacteria bacterium]
MTYALTSPPKNRRKGFTLLETLFALLILLLGFFAAIAMNSAALKSGVLNETQFQAVFLADSKIEEIRSYMPKFAGSTLTLIEHFDKNGLLLANPAQAFFTRETVINLQTPSAKTDEVRVTVKAVRSSLAISYLSIIDHVDD